jgi:hypothetical protein
MTNILIKKNLRNTKRIISTPTKHNRGRRQIKSENTKEITK